MILYNDARHLLRWGGATCALALLGVGIRVWVEPDGSDILSGGGLVGLIYALLGAALIVFAWLLAALRFVPSWWFIGSRAFWLK